MPLCAELHKRVRGIPVFAAFLAKSQFYHIGTIDEYVSFYSAGIPELGGSRYVFNAHATGAGNKPTAVCVLHSLLDAVPAHAGDASACSGCQRRTRSGSRSIVRVALS